jgi:hypothetical protein
MGNGLSMPALLSASTSALGTPSSAKVAVFEDWVVDMVLGRLAAMGNSVRKRVVLPGAGHNSGERAIAARGG